MKAIILAAGYATRLYPLTENMPKALLKIGPKTMLDYLVEEIVTLPEIDEIHIVTNHKFATHFEEWAKVAGYNLPIKVWDDGTTTNDNRLGAVGDIQFTIDNGKIDDDILVAASDNFFTFPLKLFYDAYKAYDRDTLLGKVFEDKQELTRFAVATLDEKNQIKALVEKPQEPESNIAIYALYLYKKETVPLIKQYLDEGNNKDAPGNFPAWLYKRKDVRAYMFEGECVDIGTVQAYNDACKQFANGK